MNKTLEEFFAAQGIAVAGTSNRSMVPGEFVKLSSQDGIALAYELGRTALEQYPAADGVYIGGGSWLTLPVIQRLEEEFGKPVITNQVATMWHVLHILKCWEPCAAHGRLMASR
jgi:maleate cis-trans isomerase